MSGLNPFAAPVASSEAPPREYNPFEDTAPLPTSSFDASAYAPQPVQPVQGAYAQPAATPQGVPRDRTVSSMDRITREQDLIRREQECDRLERELLSAESRLHNWPPCFPRKWQFTRHDIEGDIPGAVKDRVKQFYRLWWWGVLCYQVNVAAVLGIWWAPCNCTCTSCSTAAMFALIWSVLGPYLSWIQWYTTVYNTFKNNSGKRWALFYVNYGIHCVWATLAIIGFPGLGMVGVFLWIDTLTASYSTTIEIFLSSMVICWLIYWIFTIYLMIKTHRYYRTLGQAPVEKLIQDQVRGGAISVVAQAYSAPEQPNGGGRPPA